MALLTTTTAVTVDAVFEILINKQFVSDLEYALQHQKFITKGTLVKGGGANVLRFVEFAPPNPAASGPVTSYSGAGQSAITEGSTTANEITGITQTPTEITVTEYGEFLKIGQLYEFAAISGTREKLQKRLRDGGVASIDSAVRLAAAQSTNKMYATTAQAGAVTTQGTPASLGAAALMACRKQLFGGLAKGLEGVPGHPDMHYAAVLTPQAELDIVTEVTTARVYWSNAVVNVPGKLGQEKFVNGYIGSIYGVAVYITQNFQTTLLTSAASVNFVYADGGVGAASFEDMNPRIILNDVNSPYKNLNSIAWHAMFGTKLLSSTRVVILYSLG